MSENTITHGGVTHGTFVVEHVYDVAPEQVFAAWADPVLKARWWVGAKDSDAAPMDLDFRVDGFERASGGPEGGPVYTYEGCFRDIVANERIVSTNEMRVDGRRIAVGVVTVVFEPEGSGTRLTIVDQGTYLDTEADKPEWREGGTREQVSALDVLLKELGG